MHASLYPSIHIYILLTLNCEVCDRDDDEDVSGCERQARAFDPALVAVKKSLLFSLSLIY
jgi:hypothetical protein